MRIIAGTLKGRRLDAPTWAGPAADLRQAARDAVQRAAGPAARGAGARRVSPGPGAVGIEALSRGAAHVTFVGRGSRGRVALIAENLARCGLLMTSMRGSGHRGVGQGDGYTIERGSAEDVLSRLEPVYDVVFLDPPYDEPDLAAAVTLGVGLLGEGGICVLEHASRRAGAGARPGVAPTRRLVSGDSALAFYGAMT